MIPVYRPDLSGNEKKYVNECLDSTWVSSKGRFVEAFESAFADYVGAAFSTTACNGTASLHLALLALGITAGDEVIVPTLTYIASVNAITYVGAIPVFVDCREDSWQMDPDDVERKITDRTRAIMAVHLYGHPCDMDRLSAIADKRGVYLVEDCSEALGTLYRNRHVGLFGDVATFSFYGNKTITTGEGGMLVSNNEATVEMAVRFRGQGLAENAEYWHDLVGYNYRMTNICSAIGLAQLERVHEFVEKKRNIAQWYSEDLQGLPVTLHGEYGDVRHSYWMCSLLVADPEDRDALRQSLASHDVETRPVFPPIHTMPMYLTEGEVFPVSEQIAARGLNLPSWPGLTREQVRFISEKIGAFHDK